MEHWLEREIAQWVHTMKDRSDDPSHHERTLLPRSYILLPTPVVEHWLEQEIAQWVHTMKDRSDDPSHHERTLLPRSYVSQQTQCDRTTVKQIRTVSVWEGPGERNLNFHLRLVALLNLVLSSAIGRVDRRGDIKARISRGSVTRISGRVTRA